jgi:hypothetical protein
MATSEARIYTDRASRYLVQICEHLNHLLNMRHVDHGGGARADRPTLTAPVTWTPSQGVANFDAEIVNLTADADLLTLRATTEGDEDLRRLETLLASRVETIGRRDQLSVIWQRLGTETAGR